MRGGGSQLDDPALADLRGGRSLCRLDRRINRPQVVLVDPARCAAQVKREERGDKENRRVSVEKEDRVEQRRVPQTVPNRP